MSKIAIGSDHGGFVFKSELKEYLINKGNEIIDVGTYSKDSCNYAEFGIKVGECVKNGDADFGVAICRSGVGIAIAANKIHGIRAGVAYNDDVSSLMKIHNDVNVIVFAADFCSIDDMKRRIDLYMNATFEGGRHLERIKTIEKIDK